MDCVRDYVLYQLANTKLDKRETQSQKMQLICLLQVRVIFKFNQQSMAL